MGGISTIGAAHVSMGSAALVSAAAVLMLAKGTARHGRVGRVYAAAILAINGTALSMYDLTGRPNVFHVVALVNLATLAMGLLALRWWRRTHQPGDLVTHQRRMAMSYVGVWMAFVTEFLVNPLMGVSRMSDPRNHWPLMIALYLALFVTGGWLVLTRLTVTTVRA